LRYQCRLIVKAGGQLFPPCQITLRTLKAPIKPTIPQIAIPAGAFWMREGKPAQVIALPSFAIDHSEVSREDYALCALAGVCPMPSDVFSGRWREPQDRLRIDDAKRFCAWMGRKLPTEAQWIKAARGGHEIQEGIANPLPRRPFPWGEHPPSCQEANLRWCFVEKRGKHEFPALLPAERFLRDISPYGVRMMAGNTAEIVREGHIKGGSAFSPPQDIDAKGRIELGEGLRWVGFRCVTEN
jgi:formylglycine-generating enzyme required for sulfatase activity